MQILPLTLSQANALVSTLHRHHKPCVGHRFSLGCVKDGQVVGAAICGRPVARRIDQYKTLEVSRLVTDGTKNACSFLYSACARVAREMGFEKIQTYILASEPGTSLVAAGWVCEGEGRGGNWNVPSRAGRRTDQPMERKQRWSKTLRRDHAHTT